MSIPGETAERADVAAAWGFLTNHGLVLVYIGRHPDSTGREIAAAVGITERAVRTIVDDPRAAGYVARG